MYSKRAVLARDADVNCVYVAGAWKANEVAAVTARMVAVDFISISEGMLGVRFDFEYYDGYGPRNKWSKMVGKDWTYYEVNDGGFFYYLFIVSVYVPFFDSRSIRQTVTILRNK